MYHYLKWAAIGVFLRRNTRYLLLAAMGVVGIFLADAVYEDLADLAYKTDQSGKIAFYLSLKWVAVLFFAGLTLFSLSRLGLGRKEMTESGKKEKSKKETNGDDPLMRRLEKFHHTRPLKRRADRVLRKHR
ncbi:MAG: hypothetical protein GXO33_04510 [Epsilonproteobacteria bacterium]|nr:hypothetical protein [Campylobacterota bacterium]